MALCPHCANTTRVLDTSPVREFDEGHRPSKVLRVAYDTLIKHLPRPLIKQKYGRTRGIILWNSVTLRRRACRKCQKEHATLELPLELVDMLSSEARAKDIADAARWRKVRSAMVTLKGALDTNLGDV